MITQEQPCPGPEATFDLSRLGIFPLCLNQERVLLVRRLQQAQGSPPPALIRFGLRVHGTVTMAALGEALAAIVARHPALRCTFSENVLISPPAREAKLETFRRTGILDPGLLVQSIHETAPPPIVELDWSGLDQSTRDLALLDLVRQEDLRPFPDSEPHRIRVTRIRESADQSLLIVTLDHLVCDGHSAAIVHRQLVDRLSRPPAGDESSGEQRTRMDFPEFAAWQHRACRTRYFHSSLSFWRDQWARYAPFRVQPEDLPFALPPQSPPDQTFATLRVLLNDSETAALKAFASHAKATLFTIFLAAFACALAKRTGRSSVVIWSHLLNRVQPGTFDAVGFFINTHILGIDLPADATGLGIVRHVARVVTAALAHQELPPSYLWGALQCIPRFPDAMVLMDFRAAPSKAASPAASAVRIERAALPDAVTPRLSGLGVYVSDHGDTLDVSVSYARAAFATHGVEGLLRDLRDIVLGFATHPNQPWASEPGRVRSPRSRMAEFLVLDSGCIPVVESG